MKNDMYMKKALLLLFICFTAMEVMAQNAEVLKQINAIKRNESYFYAESTMPDEKEARSAAILMLMNNINRYIVDNGLPEDSKISEQDLAEAQSIVAKRGHNMRVFVYAEKGKYVPVEKIVEEVEPTPLVAENKIQPEQPSQPVETTSQTVEPVPHSTEQPIQQPVEQPIQQPMEQPIQSAETTNNDIKEKLGHTVDMSIILQEEWQQESMNDLLKQANLEGVINVLNNLKLSRRVKRMGTYNECQDKVASYWIVLSNDSQRSVVTVLGPGGSKRVNFRTMQFDTLENYFNGGYSAIWFEFSK